MLDWLYELLGTMLYGFSYIFGNKYVFGLLLYALLFKVLFLPFTIKQQKNQIKSANLAPKVALIRAKYKGRNDRVTQQKMQQEIMELQQREGYSPFSGCLPLLLQMPIIIFLYNVIRNPLSYVCRIPENIINALYKIYAIDAAQGGEIALTAKLSAENIDVVNGTIMIEGQSSPVAIGAVRELPDLTLFGLDLGAIPEVISLLAIIPILVAVSQWFTMWITKKINGNPMAITAADQENQMSFKMMDLMMPAMTLWFAFIMPALLGVYWIYQSVLSILQTLILSKIMPIPKFTEEDIKRIRKAEKEAEKANRAALKSQPKFRSLHYIDEDDYDDLPEVKKKDGEKKPDSKTFGDAPEIKD